MNNTNRDRKKTDYDRMAERRKGLRIPVQVTLLVNVEEKGSGFFFQTHILNFSSGGICIEWGLCPECPGYIPGGIHPDCIFHPFDDDCKDSHDLSFTVCLPGSDRTVEFMGKAAYVYKHEGRESIGIAFSRISEDTLQLLEEAGSIQEQQP